MDTPSSVNILFNPEEDVLFYELLPTLNPDYPAHVLSYGGGYDSTALLIEYIENAESRDFPLENLIVVHAVVGGESALLRELIEERLFPLLRKHNIWTIQACRNGDFKEDGITILSSTRQPQKFYLKGSYDLFTHLVTNAIVPQRGGKGRLCTLKFKADVIDWIAITLFKTNLAECQRLIGFNADEVGRIKESDCEQNYEYLIGFNSDESNRISAEKTNYRNQKFRFPLIEMGHGRRWCEERVRQFAGVNWKKSYCVNCCPFPDCNGKRKIDHRRGTNHADLREDWLAEPKRGGEAAFIEAIALSINSEQSLFEGRFVLDILQETGNQAAIDHFEALRSNLSAFHPHLTSDWGVYCVRRIFAASSEPGKKAPAPFRQTKRLFQGSEEDGMAFLEELAMRYSKTLEFFKLSHRFWTIHRPEGKNPPRPYVEEFFVLTSAAVFEKQRISIEEYDRKWMCITGSSTFIKGVDDHVAEFRRARVKSQKIKARIRS